MVGVLFSHSPRRSKYAPIRTWRHVVTQTIRHRPGCRRWTLGVAAAQQDTEPLDNPTEPQYNGLMMIDLEITMDAAVIVFLVIAPFAMVYILADALADRSE